MNIITETNDQRLDIYRLQKDGPLRQEGKIIVDSARVVERLLKTPIQLKKLLASEAFITKNRDLLEWHPAAEINSCSPEIMTSIVGHRIHSGVIAIAERPSDTPLEQLGSRIIFLNGVNNAENVGAIIRNGLAFGAPSIIADGLSCSPFVRRSIRVSMGAIFKMKSFHCQLALPCLKELKQLGYQIFTASLNEFSCDLRSVEFPKKAVLVIGCEGDGIQAEVEAFADQAIHIPMAGGIDSLNAAVASGIFLHAMMGSPAETF
ncbi:TrmH family RNA methyltransferase [Pseudobacteriovorax antillogorgiicola]|uniref:tRNA G18 (Ribose-2'-O)-methylase SpoU n=1 Tax=Pseudobacteriovorax antillogorgiicola TaxID=1513793 RepID=A0A1Y6CRF6_9BACT|nr:RNA methyltransferase [Pseudobacteriovorax antillogorgiicola]TCS41892.1 tRNA G18 (ribose-2'-O)-methylase SpoU [Pseudobacteriovorax antillogorgiicola]SMF83180.1 tRNA G18 (ribose-2'-O)-methylase SpoU [Pseudobacteriovorax antillogorgiicola]